MPTSAPHDPAGHAWPVLLHIRWLALPSLPPAYSHACIRSTARGLGYIYVAKEKKIPRRLRKKLQGSLLIDSVRA